MPHSGSLTAPKPPLNWTNTLFIAFAHLMAIVTVFYMVLVQFSWASIVLGVVWYLLCGFSITGGYHRLFAHRSYRAAWPVRLLWLLFGAASVQNSALKWSAAHRRHHTATDTDEDPYSIQKGFFWAHIGWILRLDPRMLDEMRVPDLERDRLVAWQDRNYLALAIVVGGLVPLGLGFLWGDPIGAFLVAGFLRLVLQWHATFAVNSFAHMIGSRPYDAEQSARDSAWVALFTLGEGYHNFHHRFPADYRNGVRWYHFDPTKWLVTTLGLVGLVSQKRRTPERTWKQARERRALAAS
ncbi:MAG: fatty acid desaturase [Planctomycetes bacterium]|nr:fatty acid desaturase [Planctomycetota bacterium]